ncbi:DUF2325 domain-containing protein [Leptospira sp. severe_002]|uniref:DUF2325 domain-containing protein n=1 Tax=Leptospira sp. severe_002 TaxID=2838237 RepID=UPI001E438A0D|nr:DUF2325 domain-containing protein [Leptospira sp. severe_002]
MGSHSRHLLSNLYDLPPALRNSRPIGDLIGIAAQNKQTAPITAPIDAPLEIRPKVLKRRAKIWELNTSLHCSIIGTCLSAAELRRLLIKINVAGADVADEHDLHMLGVLLAARPQEGAKLLQKTLDRVHSVALNQFAKAKDDQAIAALWEKAFAGGDVPGAYWAVLTHADSSDKMVQKAFGDVHMLSHLMGATNCADLHRMRELENEIAALNGKLERQQEQLRNGFTERDAKIERLNKMLADKIDREAARQATPDAGEVAALKDTIADLSRRLAREAGQRERLEQRLAGAEKLDEARQRAEHDRDALQQELSLIEDRIGMFLHLEGDADAAPLDLSGLTILYVGGRANQVPQFNALVRQAGGTFMHHDGGIEHAAALLPGLISRADVTLFPVDCISHNAMTSAKRACQQLGKPYLALRTSSVACLLSALVAMRPPVADGVVEASPNGLARRAAP